MPAKAFSKSFFVLCLASSLLLSNTWAYAESESDVEKSNYEQHSSLNNSQTDSTVIIKESSEEGASTADSQNGNAERQYDWQQIEGKWYYFDENTGEQVHGTQWITMEDGRKYYLTEDDSCAVGWYKVENTWYYFGNSVQLKYGWQEIEGKWYYFDESTGEQVHGPQWVIMEDGRKYYLTEDDSCAVGWYKVENTWYYFGNSVQLKYGWQEIEGKWYYFDESTGEQVHGPQWVIMEDGRKYYLTEDDSCAVGLYQIDDIYYYFRNSLQTGWFTDLDGNQRYANAMSGELNKEAGWYIVDNVKRYLLPYGIFVAPPTINNVLYTISGQSAEVSIFATCSSLINVEGMMYSWDGGSTWSNSFKKSYTVGTVIPAGTLQVRDAVGNISVYGTDLNLKKDGPYMGIDVSAYQGPIDWAAVKASGVDFAIVRALTWSNSVGYYVIDPYFEYNIRNAKANGIKVGAYLFSYAFNAEEIYEEIDYFHNSAEMKSLRKDDIQFDYPVYIDFEWDKILEKTNYDQRTEMLRLGMIRLEKYGYYPGFYSNNTWATKYYNAKYLVDCGYDFWYARYPANPDLSAGTKPLLGFEAQMWQYASDGRVNGINGNVDMNICYVDYESIIGAGGSSGGGAQLTLSVYDVNTSRQVTGAVQDILSQIVMNEVGEWSNDEVSKAQAIAAYSWIMYQQQHGNAVPSVGLATPSSAVKRAVSEVAGKALYYNGSVINAAYGSASGPYTNTAKNMWSLELPYLNTPIYSPETSWRGRSNTIKFSTMQENLSKMVGAALVNSTPHSQWIANPVFDNNGYLTSIKVCGQKVSGGTFYENCWGLYSPKFSFTYNADADSWTFVTDGNGHCVGMSQWGAYTYAKTENWNYTQILAHYYPQTTLK
nr:SpoIID/LytB domain-containing protein [Ruthenibacterium lactatiformans]